MTINQVFKRMDIISGTIIATISWATERKFTNIAIFRKREMFSERSNKILSESDIV